MWEEEVGFREFSFPVDYDISDTLKIRFHLSIPSIKKHLETLKTITAEKMRYNFETFNSILSRTDELLLITSHAEVIETVTKETLEDDEAVDGELKDSLDAPKKKKKATPTTKTVEEIDTVKSAMELRALFDVYVPLDAEESITDKYNEFFDKYNPKFVNKCECPECEHHFEFNVDVESSLFKRLIL